MTDTLTITEPGVYDLTDEQYFADPVAGGSLSSTGARLLLPPSCPAKYDEVRRNGRELTKAFNFGHAAHRRVLGAGNEIVELPFWNYKSKAAQQARDEVLAEGKIPLTPKEAGQVNAMADALKRHRFASLLFTHGEPEKVLVWQDDKTGVWCRAKLDWLPTPGRTPYLMADYKSAESVERDSVRRTVHKYGYYIQDAFYRRGVRALGLAEDPDFLFVAQEKEAPYLVRVFRITEGALEVGDRLVDKALATYAECTATGVWPGYEGCDDEIDEIDLPAYATREVF